MTGFSEQGSPLYWDLQTNNNLLLAGVHAWGMIQPLINHAHSYHQGGHNEFKFAVANIGFDDDIDLAFSQVNTVEDFKYLMTWVYAEYNLRCSESVTLIESYPKIVCVIRGLDKVNTDFVETLRFLIINGHYVGIHFVVVYDDPNSVSPLITRDFQMRAVIGSTDDERRFFGFPTCGQKFFVDSFDFTGVFKPFRPVNSTSIKETQNGGIITPSIPA